MWSAVMLLPGSAHHLKSFHLFLCYVVTIACHRWTRWVVSSVYTYPYVTTGRWRQTLKGFQRHIFLKSGVFILNVCGENESSYPLYMYLLKSLTIAAFCFSICNHFSQRGNVITACLEKKNNRRVVFFALKHKRFLLKKVDCSWVWKLLMFIAGQRCSH